MTDKITAAEKLTRNMLHASIVSLARATTPPSEGRPDIIVEEALLATYSGALACLLDKIGTHLPAETVDRIAEELTDLMEDGEPLADWVGEAADRRGMDTEKIINGVLGVAQ